MATCTLNVKIRNKEGKLVDSKLYKNLRKYTESKDEADRIYFRVAINPQWLDNLDYYETDENGEITLKSLLRNSQLDLNSEKVLKKLNKELESGEYDFDVAQSKVRAFNATTEFKDNYMATLEANENGKYKIQVVKRTADEESKMLTTLGHRYTTNVILNLLRQLKINTEFVNRGIIEGNGEYNTKYFEALLNGFLNFIKIAEQDSVEDMDETLAEETGHFIVAGLRGTPIYNRFLDWMKNENNKLSAQIIVAKEKSENKLGLNEEEELMGDLIGKRLLKDITSNNVISRFVNRIIDFAKKLVFNAISTVADLTDNHRVSLYYKAKADILKALAYAQQMANMFLGGKFSLQQVDNALKQPEIKHDMETPSEIAAYRDALRKVQNFLSNTAMLTGVEKDKAKMDAEGIINFTSFDRGGLMSNENISDPHRMQALSGLANCLNMVCELADSYYAMIYTMDYELPEVTSEKLVDSCNKLVLCRNFMILCDNLLAITRTLESAPSLNLKEIIVTDGFGNSEMVNLHNIRARLEEIVKGNPAGSPTSISSEAPSAHKNMMTVLRTAELRIAELIIFLQTGLTKIPEHKIKGFRNKGALKVGGMSISEVLTYMYDDANWFDAHIKSMAMCKDVPSQIVDFITRRAKNLSNKKSVTAFYKLQDLRNTMKKAGIKDTIIFYELNSTKTKKIFANGKEYTVPADNRFTGNLIQEYDFGRWELERHEFYTSKRNKFWQQEKEKNPNISDNLIAILFEAYMHDEMKLWNMDHSLLNENYGKNHKTGDMKYIPNDSYINEDYFKNICSDADKISRYLQIPYAEAEKYAKANGKDNKYGSKEGFLNQFLKLIEEANDELGDLAPPYYRAPLFKGVFGRRVKAIESKYAGKKALADTIKEQFFLSSEDRDFGGDHLFGTVDEDPAESELMFEFNRPKRLPIYGVRKLKNLRELSTDLFTTLLAYQSMAYDYQGLNSVASSLSIIAQVSRDRGMKTVDGSDKTNIIGTKVDNRMIHYLDKNVFGASFRGLGSKFFSKRYKVKMEDGDEITLENRIMYSKIANFFSSLARKMFLGGNVHGAVINEGTGLIEMFKESIAGEHFTISDYRWALGKYFAILCGLNTKDVTKGYNLSKHGTSLKQSVLGLSFRNPLNKTDFLSLLIKRFDVLGSLNEELRNWNTTRNGLMRFLNEDALMLPYKTGDHLMLLVPFLAMMRNAKVWERLADGTMKQIRLCDAYLVIQDENSNNPELSSARKLELKEGIYKTDNIEDIEKTERLIKLENEIENYLKSLKENPELPIPLNTSIHIDDYLDILEDNNYWIKKDKYGNIATDLNGNAIFTNRSWANNRDLEILASTIKDKINEVRWSEYDESNFTDQCRIVTNSMHGVYNKIDKAEIQLTILGNMLATMKGYAFGMAMRRYNLPSYNVIMDLDMEGSMITTFKVLYNTKYRDKNGNKQRFRDTLGMMLLPFVMHQRALNLGYSEHQYRNMRRTWADYALFGMLYILATCVFCKPKRLPGESLEVYNARVSRLRGIGYYITRRLCAELAAFNSPIDGKLELALLLDIIPSGASAIYNIGEIIYLYVGSLFENEFDENGKKKRGKSMREKADSKLQTITPYYKTDKVTSDPYKATESYMFLRKTRG